MPCRKENYIFLEQSVTVDSKEVDALVTKIGEALQLHNNNNNGSHHHHHHHQKSMQPIGASQPASMRIQTTTRARGCCLRLRSRGSSRASPYSIPSNGEQDWDQIRSWSKKKKNRLDEEDEDDDPHRLLQELILSGNLIKEAVRRLQFTGGSECLVADNVSC